MRITIEAEPVGPLNVLGELPDARIAILEGLNGIGKTLAVRLLQACVGVLPYRSETPAWKSLCTGLGDFKVIVTGLRGANEIVWRGDTREWDVTPVDGQVPMKFREITVDGKPTSLETIRGLLSVHRLGGEEGIVETLAQEADADAERVRRWARRYADPVSGPLARLERAVEESLKLLGDWSLERYRDLTASAEDAKAMVVSTGKAATEARVRRDELTATAEVRRRLDEMRQETPDLRDRIEELDSKIRTVEDAREKLQQKVRALSSQVAVTEPLLKELSNAQRTLERNRQNLAQELNIAAILARPLGVRPEYMPVSALITQLEQQVADLNVERTALDAAPSMRNLLDQVIGSLTAAEDQGLGNQVAIEAPDTELQLTVTETRIGASARRAYLEGRPPPPEAQEVLDRLDRASRSLTRARDLKSRVIEAQRFRRLVAQNEDRLNRALAAINPKAMSQIEELEAQRRETDDQLLLLAADRAALAQQLSGFGGDTTERALSVQLAQRLEQAGVAESQLEKALTEAEEFLYRSEVVLTQARDQEAEIRREVGRAQAAIQRASSFLLTHEQLAWIRTGMPKAIPAEASTVQQKLNSVDAARRRVVSLADRLGDLRAQLGAVESALFGIGRHLRGRPPASVEYVSQLQTWIGQRFSAWFNNPRVRRELLPGAEKDVEVDVARREVIWTEKGSTLSRPLEAFSSGEQAFAYTRARLAVLDEEQTKPLNRLVVLDEFGAFIAHDRLQGLLKYLIERAAEHPADQVLVVLPLSRNYAELAKTALGSEAERFGELAAQIAARKFAVQPLAA